MASEKKYIELETAKDIIMNYIAEQTVSKYPSSELCKASRMGAEGAMYELDYAPTADAVEVRHGRWKEMAEYEHGGIKKILFVCPLCGRVEYQKEPYCHCGARMDGDAE